MTGQKVDQYENNKIIDQFRELINIPAFKKVMVHKIEELKILLSEDIGHYNELHSILDTRSTAVHKKDQKHKRIPFQLKRLGRDLWIPSLPHKRKGENIVYRVIPEAIIDFVVAHQTEPGLIVAKPGLELPELPGRKFELYFERHSEDFITGVIAEDEITSNPSTPEPPLADKEVDLKSLRSFFEYLMHYPVLYTHMINQFELVWKPLLDRREQQESS